MCSDIRNKVLELVRRTLHIKTMAETTDFVSRISVKDLISAYENKSGMVRVEFTRPRARSFGNVLNKNVVVRLNELTTLDDIEKSLTKLETNLNFYEVYNKAKHVSFQEQFFNILTSIANIENEDEDAPNRKKRLISRTQTLVSFFEPEIADPVDVTDSGGEYFVSVKKLKENFQPKIENGVQQVPKPEKITASSVSVSTKQSQIETTVPENAHEEKLPEAVPSNKEEPTGPVSVTKLRSLFEQRSEENSKGLEIITVDKQPLLNNLGGSVQNLSLAYTERNLGTYRLKRSVSGNYMNYSGLLKRVDINKSNSVVDLHRNGVGNSIENMGVEDTIKNGNIEEAAHQSQNSSKDNRNEEHVAIVKGSSEVQVKYSTSTELEQNDSSQNPGDDQVYYSTATFTTGNQNLDPHNENTASHQGFGEEEVRYSKSASVPVNQTESSKEKQTLSYQGFNEETVGYSRADSVEEDTGTKTNTITDNELSFKGVDEIEINSGTAVEVTNVAEHVAKLEAAISENVSESTTISGTETAIIERNTESFSDGTSSSSDRRHLDERETGVNHVAKTDDVTDEDSDDEREQSLIEEVIDKMDVEQTLANVNLVVNPEDLKNADDEFEKLVENNESSKVTS
ncbi:hypothetical protein NQ315_001864 [Exocentrus adspersus]|uniref:Uncharacterized protein n=1 Tax=Exocentrus adspersus TaxID=1586481 RepID=A0AAV8WC79_9CUCU|nr:hypothetical protein NQ315_001864 [Exocentrus adspersus]